MLHLIPYFLIYIIFALPKILKENNETQLIINENQLFCLIII